MIKVISRYLGMFSLDRINGIYPTVKSGYFPLSWDVLIRQVFYDPVVYF